MNRQVRGGRSISFLCIDGFGKPPTFKAINVVLKQNLEPTGFWHTVLNIFRGQGPSALGPSVVNCHNPASAAATMNKATPSKALRRKIQAKSLALRPLRGEDSIVEDDWV
jgi:hypothetical protein